jgi:hypothetical protein
MRHAHHSDDFDALLDVARTFNTMECDTPMTDAEVFKTAESAWKMQTEGRNWIGQGRRVAFHHDDIDGLMHEHPDAFLLETKLKRNHWNRDFVIANAMSEDMPGGGWSRKRLAKARDALLQRGRIEMVQRRGHRTPTVYRWPDLRVVKNDQ